MGSVSERGAASGPQRPLVSPVPRLRARSGAAREVARGVRTQVREGMLLGGSGFRQVRRVICDLHVYIYIYINHPVQFISQ